MPNSTLFFITLCLSRVPGDLLLLDGRHLRRLSFRGDRSGDGDRRPAVAGLVRGGHDFCQLAGSALIVFNPAGYGWIGSGMLIVFTLLTIPLGHAFWAFSEPRRTEEFYIALEHITVVGGLIMSALFAGYRR